MNTKYITGQFCLVRRLALCLTVGALLPSVSAEITGSGHHVLGCEAQLSINYFVDLNENGIQEANEPPVSNVAVAIALTDQPQLGTDVLHSDENGNVLFYNMCDSLYTIKTSLGTVPADAEYSGVSVHPDDADLVLETVVTTASLTTDASVSSAQTVNVAYHFSPNECGLSVLAGCAPEPSGNVPSTPDYDCKKPVEELTMTWNGDESIRVRAHLGKLDAPVIADIDNIAPGMSVKIPGYQAAGSDVIWELYAAGTLNKIGESAFHLSCSDQEMNGPEDCGVPAGDGKSNDKCSEGNGSCLNLWQFEGLIDMHGEINCNEDYPTEPILGASSACQVSGDSPVNYQYRLSNIGHLPIEVETVVDSLLGPLPGAPEQALQPGDSQVFAFADSNSESLVRTLAVTAATGGTTCAVETEISVTVDPAASNCDSLSLYLHEKKHDALKLKVANSSNQDYVLTDFSVSWPEENSSLKEAKISGDKFVQGLISWGEPVSFHEDEFVSVPDKRTVESGKEETLEIKFEEHVHDSPQIYWVEVQFGEACTLTYQDF